MLKAEVQKLITPLGYEVVALELSHSLVTLTIDFLSNINATAEDEKRITLNDCVTVNNAVSALFEETTLLDGTYNLEVSSPGIERRLRKPEDFERFKARLASINTKQKNYIGILEGLNSDGTAIKMTIKQTTGDALVTLPFELITKAHLKYVPSMENKSKKQGVLIK